MCDPEEESYLQYQRENEPSYVPSENVYTSSVPTSTETTDQTVWEKTIEEIILEDPTRFS